ncbi:MAG TPA: GYD domain-containing protein [Euryarchaeota archaeon]|nr:MAG: GYD domain superfamily [Thermococci archaeon]RLF95999.1 MAG: GYD domain superfamily [Thermococci archaeon]HDI10318.1 GYD domain-containing protein [Euryarchaeota archaeon]
MGVYVMLTRLTAKGRETVRDNPERILEVNQEVEEMGAKLIAQYALLGPYDFLNILEAPDEATVAKISVELGRRGTIEPLTMVAIPIEELIRRIHELG